ncbi:serine/threonine-protein kinase [Gimesia fumaroli]|uniref:Serine/threonine-protein kinase StkP n=1 Tax=Gimesia fumaroli TaxID=2527976 RepID=A0A518I927_9PLAN|nr:serine/threonine-protein kinase [Gimesia fumaroli]QDV49616.1 Serine/threonine-protein kinase StkP [Gimesia fumaroli]
MEKCISESLLVQYLVNELDEEVGDLVRDHLNQCSLCQTKAETLSDDIELKEWHECHQRQQGKDDLQTYPFSEDRLDRLFNSTVSSIQQSKPFSPQSPASHNQKNNSSINQSNSASFNRKLHQDTLRVIGSYHLIKKIGQGGMGVVYQAIHAHLKKQVVLKLLLNNDWENSNQSLRFYREMELVGQLDHPNIVKATDAGETDDTCFLVMEYLEGHDLKKILKTERSLSITAACSILRQAANGFQYIHNNNLIHRDIKPSNLFLTTEGKIKILDLGLAGLSHSETSFSDLTDSNCIMGSAYYMAPEQAMSVKTIDQRSDIYSLGCTFYQLLTGRLPFKRNTPVETIIAHREDIAPRLSDYLSDVPETLEELFQSMIQKDPNDRIQTMAEVVKKVDDFMEQEQDSLLHEASDTSLTHSQELIRLCQNTDLSPPVEALSQYSSTLFQPTHRFWNKKNILLLIMGIALLNAGLFYFIRFDQIPPPVSNIPKISPEEAQNQRAAALWALEHECELTLLLANGVKVQVNNTSEGLPKDDFQIITLKLYHNQPLDENALSLLKNIKSLNELRLDDCVLGDNALAPIKGLTSLTVLDIHHTKLTDKGLSHISELKNLKTLSIKLNPDLTDTGLQVLNQLPRLEDVDLARLNITDKGITFIQNNSNLTKLNISETNVSDASVPYLIALEELESLRIKKTAISEKGIEQIRNAFKDHDPVRLD